MYKIVDVGGQRSERRKWVNVFSDVNAILFVVSLSGYDECLLEDRDANQMRESMVVFSQLVGNPLFKKTCIGAAPPTCLALEIKTDAHFLSQLSRSIRTTSSSKGSRRPHSAASLVTSAVR
jgi:hypothetical protein